MGTRWAAWGMAMLLGSALAAAQYADRDSSGAPRTSAHAPQPAARVDINHASLEELLAVPGMTPSWAGRIIRFRPYRSKLDLLRRGVVTSQVYERVGDDLIAHRDRAPKGGAGGRRPVR
ncbi:MAG: ComEA family DNA-binding protein [Terracidiphilus sp.]